jgi:RNA polymerase subunit RPABC4/transcription elongation factor Spt4
MGNKQAYKICPHCDYFCNIEENKNYCPKCGTKLIDKCQNCGAPIDYPYAKFCPVCGAPYRKNTSYENLKEIK